MLIFQNFTIISKLRLTWALVRAFPLSFCCGSGSKNNYLVMQMKVPVFPALKNKKNCEKGGAKADLDAIFTLME